MVKLSSTSALVLLWARQQRYRTKGAIEFLDGLDLEEGRSLYQQCNEGFPYAEVIMNRKFGVMHLVRKCIAEYGEDLQIVIGGAGFDPLGIELTGLYPGVTIFELDRENMGTKSAMVARPDNEPHGRISFIHVDIGNAVDVLQRLTDRGWDRSCRTLLVLEGISYYVPTESLQELVDAVRPDSVIFEYLRSDSEVAADRRQIPLEVFGTIADLCDLHDINRFERSQVETLFANMSVKIGFGMKRLERMRTGSNRFFPTEESGWIDVCLLGDSGQ